MLLGTNSAPLKSCINCPGPNISLSIMLVWLVICLLSSLYCKELVSVKVDLSAIRLYQNILTGQYYIDSTNYNGKSVLLGFNGTVLKMTSPNPLIRPYADLGVQGGLQLLVLFFVLKQHIPILNPIALRLCLLSLESQVLKMIPTEFKAMIEPEALCDLFTSSDRDLDKLSDLARTIESSDLDVPCRFIFAQISGTVNGTEEDMVRPGDTVAVIGSTVGNLRYYFEHPIQVTRKLFKENQEIEMDQLLIVYESI